LLGQAREETLDRDEDQGIHDQVEQEPVEPEKRAAGQFRVAPRPMRPSAADNTPLVQPVTIIDTS
jgi:hypothetical protein